MSCFGIIKRIPPLGGY